MSNLENTGYIDNIMKVRIISKCAEDFFTNDVGIEPEFNYNYILTNEGYVKISLLRPDMLIVTNKGSLSPYFLNIKNCVNDNNIEYKNNNLTFYVDFYLDKYNDLELKCKYKNEEYILKI